MAANHFIPYLHVGRGIAALLVVCLHACIVSNNFNFGKDQYKLADFFVAGGCGVQFFFVLSGFIIYHIHQNDEINSGSKLAFIKKRFVRVFPIYWIVLLPLIPALIYFPYWMPQIPRTASCVLANFLLIFREEGMIVSVAWTLCHEVLFYFVFYFSFYYIKRWHLVFMFWSVAILLYGYTSRVAATPLLFERHQTLKFWLEYLLNVNNLLFGFGIFAASIINQKPKFFSKSVVVRALIAVGLMGSIAIYIKQNSCGLFRDFNHISFWLESLLYGIFFSILLGGVCKLKINHENYLQKFLKNLGDASYSIYLIHLFTITIVAKLCEKSNFISSSQNSIFVILILTSLVSGFVFHRLVEIPLLRYLRKKSAFDQKFTQS